MAPPLTWYPIQPLIPKSEAPVRIFGLLSLFFVIYSNPKVKSPKRRGERRGSVYWIEFSTSQSSEGVLMAAASRAMRRAGATLFSFVK